MSGKWLAWLVVAMLLAPCAAFGQSVREVENETAEPPAGGAAAAKNVADLDRVRTGILEATNRFREQQGRGKLKVNADLNKAAQSFAEFMARTDKYGHTADGREPWDRMAQAGYDYCIALENIAYAENPEGFASDALTKEFVEAWEHSPPHRKNMLDPDVSEIGVGVAHSDKTGRYYAVQDYGRPKADHIAFKIANETDAAVKYTIDGKDFALEPGYTVTQERCRPPELRFRWPEGADATPAAKEAQHPAAGSAYVVRKDDAGAFTVDRR